MIINKILIKSQMRLFGSKQLELWSMTHIWVSLWGLIGAQIEDEEYIIKIKRKLLNNQKKESKYIKGSEERRINRIPKIIKKRVIIK